VPLGRDMNHLAVAWDARIEALLARMPAWIGGAIAWLRKPSRRGVRMLAGALLVLGGLLSILPILGIWMLPLGLALLAEDFPGLKPRLERAARWLERRWAGWFGRPSGAALEPARRALTSPTEGGGETRRRR
jgi:hypothetical protein